MFDEPEVNLLLVEDNKIDVQLFQRAMRRAGLEHPTRVAGDGRHALNILRGEDPEQSIGKPNIVILDIKMPRMDGFEFLNTIRSDPDLHKLVVFILTTSSDPDDRERAYEKNVAGYLVKCNETERFVETLKMIESYLSEVQLPLH